jgi:hypothetical protein
LLGSSRCALKGMNLPPKGEIMGGCKQVFVVSRREDGSWT